MKRGDTIMQVRFDRFGIDDWSAFIDLAEQVEELELHYDAVDLDEAEQVTFGWIDARGWFSAGVHMVSLQDELVNMALREDVVDVFPIAGPDGERAVGANIDWDAVEVSDVQGVIEEVMGLEEIAALCID